MSILIKHMLQNIKEKKFITALIVLSVAISGALFFVALSMEGILDTVANNDFSENASMVFLMIFIVTSFMSIFIVWSSFKYLVATRTKTLGTFRSVGADKRKCRNILLLESLAYGLIAALLAIGLGILLLVILGNQLSNGEAKTIIPPLNLFISFAFCIVLSVACSYFPIRANEKYSVKEIISQTHNQKTKSRLPALIIGIIMITISLLFTNLVALKYNSICIIIGLLFALGGFVVCVRALFYYSFSILNKIFKNSLITNGLKENRAHVNIGVLIAIAVAVVFLTSSTNAVLVKATDETFSNYNYSIQVVDSNLDDIQLDAIKANVGTSNALGVYFKGVVEVKDNIPLANLFGLDIADLAFYNFTPVPSAINNGEIVVSQDYLSRQNLKIGDKVWVNNNEFTITAAINQMFPSGNIGIITRYDYQTIFETTNYTYIAVKAATPNETATLLRGLDFTAVTVAEMQAKAKQINADIFVVLDYIVIVSTFAGIFGVLNNLLIAFNSQKRERALLRSLGMSKQKSAWTIIIQALITGLLGGVLGLMGGLLLAGTIPAILVVFEFPAQAVPLSAIEPLICIGASTAICAVASCLSLISNSKMNIVQTLKEEVL